MIYSAAITNIGLKRNLNQDSYECSDVPVGPLPDLFVVADGMGGHKAGDYASRYTVDKLREKVARAGEGTPREILEQALTEINTELREIADSSEEYQGMGTTCVAATLDGDKLMAANVGDSRLYLIRGETIRQITVDHSLVEEMVLAGGLTEKNARSHPDRNIITRALGADDRLEIDFFTELIKPGDRILLCTDGLTNMVEDDRILILVRRGATIEETARSLIEEANRSGGKDNITVILIDPFGQEFDK